METGILPPELRSIEQLFTPDAVFSVPRYQRNFAWGPDEAEELWDDAISAIDRKSDYFLGTIVLQKTEPARFEIIDGQQRLACLTMIFSAIRNVFLSSSDSRSEQIYLSFLGARDFTKQSSPQPKLILNRINNETFVKYVIESKSLEDIANALKPKSLHASNRLLLQAYKFLLERVTSGTISKGTEADQFLVPLIDCLRSSIKFITIPVTSAEDANLFFESLNARGKELAISDLVKNRLYYESEENLSRAEQLWENMETQLIRRPIPEYLRHYWIAKKADNKGLNVREKQLYRSISTYVKGKKSRALELLVDLSDSSHYYAMISDYRLWPDDEAYGSDLEESLKELRLFRVTQCNPLLLNGIQRFKSPKEITKTFRIVANFSFRYFIIGNQSPGNLERVSAKIALGIREGSLKAAKDIGEEFLSINPDKAFRSDFSLATIPPSRSQIARYFLSKLSNYMSRAAKKGGAEQVVNQDSKQVTLEHVLPQNFSTVWRSYFSRGVDPNDFVDRIGNLTLLTQKINSDAANSSFPEKKKIAFDHSSLPINAQFSKLTKWGESEIESRQAEMANVALEVWKIH